MKLKKREKVLAIIFGIFLFLFLIQQVAFLPFSEKLDIIETQIKASEKKLKRLLYIDSQKDEIINLYNQVKPYVETGKTEEDIVSIVMKKIEEMSKECKITLLNMKPETSSEVLSKGNKARKVTLNIEGSQRDIVNFLYKLENSNYPLSIKKIDFKIKDRSTNLMEADLDVYFIYFL